MPASPRARRQARDLMAPRHTQIRGACRYGDACHYATQAEYDALDWDARVPLDAVGPHAPPTTVESPKGPHAEGGSESLV